jgi:hypothetical protein
MKFCIGNYSKIRKEKYFYKSVFYRGHYVYTTFIHKN